MSIVSAHLSVSQMQTFQNCPHLWSLRYDLGWQRRRVAPPLDGGIAVHEAQAAAWRQHWLRTSAKARTKVTPLKAGLEALDRWYKRTLLRAQRYEIDDEEYIARTDQILETARFAFHTAHDAIRWKDWTVAQLDERRPLIEAQLVVPLPGWEGFVGVVDLVATDADGYTWVIDWKCPALIPSEIVAEFSLQKAVYQKLLAAHGVHTDGSLMGYTRFRIPSVPKVNKNGTISRQEVATTWPVYKKTCEQNGQDPADYADIQEKLESRPWFKWAQTFRGEHEIDATWNEIVLPLADTIRRQVVHGGHTPRSISGRCQLCDFAEPCIEGLRGSDVDVILGLGYTRPHDRRPQPDEGEFSGSTA